MSAETLLLGWNKGKKQNVSEQAKRTSQTKVSERNTHMTHRGTNVIVFVLLLAALMVVTFNSDARLKTDLHGLTIGFTGLGVLCAAYLSVAPSGGIIERCLVLCVGSAAAHSSCSGASVGHLLLVTVATWLVVFGTEASTINVRHACTMTTSSEHHAKPSSHSRY